MSGSTSATEIPVAFGAAVVLKPTVSVLPLKEALSMVVVKISEYLVPAASAYITES